MSAADFIEAEVRKLRSRAVELESYGAGAQAQTCSKIANDLEANFQAWFLEELPVSAAAQESGYSEERLRQMAREGEIPHTKGPGAKGHLLIARRDLPRRPTPAVSQIGDIGERLLQKNKAHLRPAS